MGESRSGICEPIAESYEEQESWLVLVTRITRAPLSAGAESSLRIFYGYDGYNFARIVGICDGSGARMGMAQY